MDMYNGMIYNKYCFQHSCRNEIPRNRRLVYYTKWTENIFIEVTGSNLAVSASLVLYQIFFFQVLPCSGLKGNAVSDWAPRFSKSKSFFIQNWIGLQFLPSNGSTTWSGKMPLEKNRRKERKTYTYTTM